MPKSSAYLQRSWVLDNGHLLVQVLRSRYFVEENSPQGILDCIADEMLLEFAERGCPIIRATTPLSTGNLKTKGHGKLSIQFAADYNWDYFSHYCFCQSAQLYGAVANTCEELEFQQDGMNEDLLPTNVTIDRRNPIRGVNTGWDTSHLNVDYLMHGHWVAYFKTWRRRSLLSGSAQTCGNLSNEWNIDDFMVIGLESNVERCLALAKDKLKMQDAVRLYKTGEEARRMAMNLLTLEKGKSLKWKPFLNHGVATSLGIEN